MPTDDEIKTAGREGKRLGVRLLEPNRDVPLGCLARRLAEHCDGEVNADDAMTKSRELEGEKSCTTADVEHLQRAPSRHDKLEDTVPCGPFGGSADTVAEILIEVRRSPIPVRRDLPFDDISGLPAL